MCSEMSFDKQEARTGPVPLEQNEKPPLWNNTNHHSYAWIAVDMLQEAVHLTAMLFC